MRQIGKKIRRVWDYLFINAMQSSFLLEYITGDYQREISDEATVIYEEVSITKVSDLSSLFHLTIGRFVYDQEGKRREVNRVLRTASFAVFVDGSKCLNETTGNMRAILFHPEKEVIYIDNLIYHKVNPDGTYRI